MIAAAAEFVADQDAKSVAIFMIAMCCLAIVVVVAALIYFADRDRVRLDTTEHDFSNMPGFSRDQLERVARMEAPPANEPPRYYYLPHFLPSRTSPEVALRTKRAGTVPPFTSPRASGAGVSNSGVRRGS